MGNGSSSSSQQERQGTGREEHTYEEIQEQDRRENNRFNRNCSIVTLDIKPGEWRRFAEAQRSKEDAGGRDVWWGDYDQGWQRRSGREEEKDSRAAGRRCQEGGWDTLDNAGWKDEAVGQWSTYKTYKRCVSLDVKQIDPDLEEKSEF